MLNLSISLSCLLCFACMHIYPFTEIQIVLNVDRKRSSNAYLVEFSREKEDFKRLSCCVTLNVERSFAEEVKCESSSSVDSELSPAEHSDELIMHPVMSAKLKALSHSSMLVTTMPSIAWSNACLMTSILSPKATDDSFGLPLITCAQCHVRTTALETEALALSAHEFGTVCHVACEHLTSATNILKHYWRHICFD